jgi:hypothetical protein
MKRSCTVLISAPTCDDVAQVVGEASVPCECRHCPPHRPGTHCTCDTAARWMVRIAHNASSGASGNMCGVVAPLCDLCLEVARVWAVQSVRECEACIFCGAPVRVASDLITSVVSLW